MSAWEAVVDPTRREIITRLATGEQTAGQIAEGFAISRPGVSRHLRVLREAGVISVRRERTSQIYSLNPAAIAEIEQWAASVRQFWGQRLDALETEVRRGQRRPS